MAIIYSYPETLELLPTDMLIGTSTIRVAGKKKNITKNFTLELLKEFILDGYSNVQWGDITGNISNQSDLQAALNAKQNNITLTTTGSSGPATLVGSTLNVPDYSAASTYVYIQNTPATTWTIQHNLNRFPSVSVVNINNVLMYGLVTYVDLNNLIIEFSAGFSGKAYMN
jgi:hypothetical protein